MTVENVVRSACPHDCPDTCALRVTVKDGIAVRVQGDPDHPPTHGALCTKVARYPERTYHPERLLYPLRRSGPKGSGQFERVSWEYALADIAARLGAIAARNAEAILPYSYAGTMGLVQGESMAARFFNKLGASRLDRTICSSAGGEAMDMTYGAKVGMHLENYADSKLIVIWGSNSITSNLHFWTFAQAAKRKGAKLWCIDPRRTDTADKCHRHLALRPGTDGALALAMMRELVAHNALDLDFIEQHMEDWSAVREEAMSWTLERAATECGVTPAEIAELSRDYVTTKPAAIRLNYGMQRVVGGGNAVRLIALLPCLIGAWRDKAGGLLLSSSGWFKPQRDSKALERPDLLGKRNPRTINMSAIGDALLQEASTEFGPRVEALVVYNSNPVAVAPDSRKVVAGFAREDLFTVVLEHFQTDTADYADYILPATTQLEHADIHLSYGHTYVMLNNAAIGPLGEAKANTQIFRDLARQMGFTEQCFSDSDEQLMRCAFPQVDYAALREQGWSKLPIAEAPFAHGGFPTSNGKVQIAVKGHGVPRYIKPAEANDANLRQRFPLAMISPPARNYLNSSFVNVISLRDMEGEPLLEMHPQDAASREISDGALVKVFNERGEYRCKAQITTRARPGMVVGLGVWWRKFGLAGTNVNELTSERLTDIGRGATFYDCQVEVAVL